MICPRRFFYESACCTYCVGNACHILANLFYWQGELRCNFVDDQLFWNFLFNVFDYVGENFISGNYKGVIGPEMCDPAIFPFKSDSLLHLNYFTRLSLIAGLAVRAANPALPYKS